MGEAREGHELGEGQAVRLHCIVFLSLQSSLEIFSLAKMSDDVCNRHVRDPGRYLPGVSQDVSLCQAVTWRVPGHDSPAAGVSRGHSGAGEGGFDGRGYLRPRAQGRAFRQHHV